MNTHPGTPFCQLQHLPSRLPPVSDLTGNHAKSKAPKGAGQLRNLQSAKLSAINKTVAPGKFSNVAWSELAETCPTKGGGLEMAIFLGHLICSPV